MKYLLTDIETDRLRFRPLEEKDRTAWTELFRDAKAVKFLGMQDFGSPEECCAQWFRWTYDRYSDDLGGQNILEEKSTGNIVGQAGLLLREFDGNHEIEIAYSILPQFRRKGYAAEASQKCRDFAFQNNFRQSLVSMIHPENTGSIKTALKNGMILDKSVLYNGKIRDVYRITKDRWLTMQSL